MKNLSKSDLYSDWMAINSPGGDSRVYSLTYEDNPLTVSIAEKTDMEIEVRGDEETVHLFIKQLSAEVAAISVAELCKCISKSTRDELKTKLRQSLLVAIDETFTNNGVE